MPSRVEPITKTDTQVEAGDGITTRRGFPVRPRSSCISGVPLGRDQWFPVAHVVECLDALWALDYIRRETRQLVWLNLVWARQTRQRYCDVG
jgi:hypothetical protein